MQVEFLENAKSYQPGRRHEVVAGEEGGGRIPSGGRIQVSQNHVPPNSDLSSDFANFILEILENLKILTNIQKISFKNVISGDIPQNFEPGGCVPPPISPGGDANGYQHHLILAGQDSRRAQ